MTRDDDHDPDPNLNGATIVAGPAARAAVRGPAELEAAWTEWSRTQTVDKHVSTLLRAAFEAGWKAGQ